MANTPVSANILNLLRALQQEGSLPALIEQLQSAATVDSGFEVVSDEGVTGTMSDGSKRRLEDDFEDGQPAIKQSPVPPSAKASSEGYASRASLPPGVKSLEEWGTTILTAGKFEKEDLTYGDVVSSTVKEKMEYVKWALSQNSLDKFSPVMKDFISYVKAFESSQHTTATYTFPGSCIPRKTRK